MHISQMNGGDSPLDNGAKTITSMVVEKYGSKYGGL